ncbi:hypothetical protein ScPMuIL_015065 [Solemya velum]
MHFTDKDKTRSDDSEGSHSSIRTTRMAVYFYITLIALVSVPAVYGWLSFMDKRLPEPVTCADNECRWDGRCIAHGEDISDNPCNGCYCYNGMVACASRSCSRTCSDRFSQQCCPECMDADI